MNVSRSFKRKKRRQNASRIVQNRRSLMTHQCTRRLQTVAGVLAVFSFAIPGFGQTAKTAGISSTPQKSWSPPRTPDGQPDMQGAYTGPDTSRNLDKSEPSLPAGIGAYDSIWAVD